MRLRRLSPTRADRDRIGRVVTLIGRVGDLEPPLRSKFRPTEFRNCEQRGTGHCDSSASLNDLVKSGNVFHNGPSHGNDFERRKAGWGDKRRTRLP